MRYDDVALLALLTQDLDQARAFADRVLGPLAFDDEATRRLADTLMAVLEEQGSPRRAGLRLGVHENTVAKRLRTIEAMLEETARSLGLGPWRTFYRVTLPRLRLALLGGGLVIALHLLGEYGGFAVLRYRTFTTEIYNAYKLGFDAASAALLSLVLVVVCILVLSGEMGLRGHSSHARIGAGAARRRRRVRLGPARTAASLLALSALVGLALAVPLGALGYWILQGSSTTLPSASIWGATLNTLLFGLGAAALSCVLALPVALLAARRRGVVARLLERAVFLPRALPGLVVGLALVFFPVRYAAGL
ncbi:MAG: helix-turn-helix domain-containing protein, partial [Solirubrobacterales bacterium]|nr:helix-turn-helix domain-containing protein [Solirubrobacterales bacterium]